MARTLPDPAPADRIEIKWRAPLDPRVHGYGPRIDRGGYVYSLFRDGARIVSGTGATLDDIQAHALRVAADKGLQAPPVFVLSTAPAA